MTAEPNAAPDQKQHALIGQTVGKYRITRLVGTGGMGAVFEAQHETINQRVAIKVLHHKLTSDPAAVQRFMHEADTTSRVHHVGLVRVFDFGQLDNGAAYMMMEFLEGESLKARLASVTKLDLAPSLRITRQIAAALAAAHEKRIVHRDLKPENVLLVPDPETASGERAKVLDFGIAKIVDPDAAEIMKTTTGAIVGTPTYMSPEQCRGGQSVTDRSDVYSLGCMLYQMLCGSPPFTGSGAGDLIAQHIVEKPRPLRELAPNVSPDVETMVHKMLEKKPEDRPSMRELLGEIEQLGLSTTASSAAVVIVAPPPAAAAPAPAPVAPPAPAPERKGSPAVLLGALGILVAGGLGLVVLLRQPAPGGMASPPSAIAAPNPPAVAQVTPPPAAPPAAPTAPAAVKLSIASEPPGAQVVSTVDGKILGKTPWQLERPRPDGKLEVVLRLDGYAETKLVFDGQSDDARQIKLAAQPPAPVPAMPATGEATKKNALWKKPVGKPVGKPGKTRDDDLVVPVVR
ncbi:MAG: serine/threonine-protein kinase [Polyangia bacterium]